MTATTGSEQRDPLREFLAAKAALDAAPAPTPQRAAAWQRLCAAAAALGMHEAAYMLAAAAAAEPAGGAPPDGRMSALAALAAPLPRGGPPPPLPDHLERYRARYWRDAGLPPGRRRVFAASDMHVDKAGARHMEWVQGVGAGPFQNDVLIVAGDVADTPAGVRATLAALRPKFGRLVYVPGNHELWLGPCGGGGAGGGGGSARGAADSFARLMELRQLCADLDVDTAPILAAPGLVVAPLLSWYDAAFDRDDPRPGQLRFDRFCSWPTADTDVWQVMLRLNTPYLQPPPPPAGGAAPPTHAAAAAASLACAAPSSAAAAPGGAVISTSHFLPHPGLPSSPYVRELRKAVGCAGLLRQLAAVGAAAHVYGHTHINGAARLADPPAAAGGGGGARLYVQYALEAAFEGLPRTARGAGGLPGLACVFDGWRVVEGLALADIETGVVS
ncbi:MAG: hypothetical protein J3K34DRAFT_490958 [Monoraphidium minutum]|nr:MAG: hypothetical protein J3K34DRAFT_490958 [Monoraphidium minutum]